MTDERLIGEGDLLPQFSLTTPEGRVLTLDDLAGRPAVLFFYPKDDTPGCTSEARDFSDLTPEFDRIGVTLLGISKDPADRHRKFIAKHGLHVPLATDLAEHGLSDALGIWVDKSMYGRTYKGMSRTTYLVDASGRIVRMWRKVKVKGHAAEVFAAARSFCSKA